MNSPSRFEIEKLANEIFAADQERRIREFAKEETRVLAQVRSTHNAGGYAPALVQCGAARLRSKILTLANVGTSVRRLCNALQCVGGKSSRKGCAANGWRGAFAHSWTN
jgi:hypothetical protein